MATTTNAHRCDTSCTSANSHRDLCECPCGGENHGRDNYMGLYNARQASKESRMHRLGGGNPFHGLPTPSDDLFGAA